MSARMQIACMAGARNGEVRGKMGARKDTKRDGREDKASFPFPSLFTRETVFSLPFSFLAPATQARIRMFQISYLRF